MSLTPRIDRLETNKIINGNFDFWQRGVTFAVLDGYGADRFRTVSSAGISNPHINRLTDVPTVSESGFKSNYSMELTATAADTPTGSETYRLDHRLEGLEIQDIIGKTVSLSFWIKSNRVGTYAVSIKNQSANRSYTLDYTIDSNLVWEKKTFEIPIEDATWALDETLSMIVKFVFAGGPSRQATPGTWVSGDLDITANTDNGADAVGNEFKIAQVMLNEGDALGRFHRAGRTISEELTLCQRYYEKSYDVENDPGSTVQSVNGAIRSRNPNSTWHDNGYFKVEKRSTPTGQVYSPVSGAAGTVRNENLGTNVAAFITGISKTCITPRTSAVTNVDELISGHWTADAEL